MTAAAKRTLAVAAALTAAVFSIAVIDFRSTTDSVAAVPPPCEPATAVLCNEQRNAELMQRLEDASELETGFEDRATLYALAVIAIIAVAAAALWRARDPSERSEFLRSLGTAGVVALIAGLVVIVTGPDGLVGVPAGPVLAPGGALVVAAAAGSVLTGSGWRVPMPLAWAGIACAVATAALAAIAIAARGECTEPRPGSIDALLAVAAVTAGAGVVCGLVLLASKRWFSALLCLGAGPFFLLIGALGSACLS
jgi:hypothetical protein